MTINVRKMRFRKLAAFAGQHNFWMELGGFARVAIADQSVMGREGFMYQPQHADHGLLFVDFNSIKAKDGRYDLPQSTSPGISQQKIWGLPVVDIQGEKFTTLLVREEYDWFMLNFG
jgi:hypothetical protein